MGDLGVQPLFPGVGQALAGILDNSQAALFPSRAAPVIDELVTSYANQPGDIHFRHVSLFGRPDRRHERLGRQIFRHSCVAAPGQEVAVYLRQGHVVDGHHRICAGGLFLGAHTIFIAWGPPIPNIVG